MGSPLPRAYRGAALCRAPPEIPAHVQMTTTATNATDQGRISNIRRWTASLCREPSTLASSVA